MPLIDPLVGPDDQPVPWVTADELTCEVEDPDNAILAATEVYYVLSGRIYGLRQRNFHPSVCQDSCPCTTEWRQWGEAPEWSSVGTCSCSATDLRLPLVYSVEGVFIDGVILDPANYRLYDRSLLVRRDGGTFPCCQLLSVTPDALVVVATAGTTVPEFGKLAVIEMACQIAAAGTAACKLPTRVQTISRQGMSWTVLDPQDFLDNGRTGLYFGDLFLATVNPAKLRMPVRVMSPDTPRTSVAY